MKKIILISLAVLIIFIFMSCGTVKIVSQSGKKSFAYLMPEYGGEIKDVRAKWNFYLFWGLVPLGDNSTNDMIQEKEKVRVKTEGNFFTYLLQGVTYGIISANVTEVEVLKDESVDIDNEKKEIE